jgi:hypothetical protein
MNFYLFAGPNAPQGWNARKQRAFAETAAKLRILPQLAFLRINLSIDDCKYQDSFLPLLKKYLTTAMPWRPKVVVRLVACKDCGYTVESSRLARQNIGATRQWSMWGKEAGAESDEWTTIMRSIERVPREMWESARAAFAADGA